MDFKKKIYILVTVFGIINLILIFLVILPLLKSIKEDSQNLISQKREFLLFSQKKENLKNLEKIYKANQEDLAKIESFLVDPEAPIDFISFLEKTAQDSQAEIKISLASGKKEESDSGSATSFNISLEGSYPNFLKFLERLENSSYLIEILNLNIKRLEKSPGNINVVFLIRVLTKS